MKRNIITLFCGLGLMLTSCTGFLTEKPKTFLTPDDYFNTENQMKAAVNGLYSHLGGSAALKSGRCSLSNSKSKLHFSAIFTVLSTAPLKEENNVFISAVDLK